MVADAWNALRGLKMRMVRDQYTGELYDADKWYRGPYACWINKEEEARWNARMAEKERLRREMVNASRMARGKRKRSDSSFVRSSKRYREWLRLDSGISFGEWLKTRSYERSL